MRGLAALVFAAALSSGCLVISLQPAYDDSSIVFDERLVGQWENAEDRSSAAFDRAEWRSYRVTYADRSATTAFQGNLTKVGVSLYLDLTEPRGADAGPYLIPAHGVYRIELTGDTLAASALDYAWFTRAAAHKTSRGLTMTMDPRRNIVLASPTSELRVWLARAPDEAFGARMTFVKKPSSSEQGGRVRRLTLGLVTVVCTQLIAQAPPAASAAGQTQRAAPSGPDQTQQDEYTEYALLAPETASFKILYEVSSTTAGATNYFNPIRKGSQASDEAVFDMMTGQPLKFEQVTGAAARTSGFATADLDTDYIRVHLARPVPADGGQARLRIVKTYKDAKSYYKEGDTIVFNRGLGIRRNAVVLPSGYQLAECNVPSQVLSDADGRIRITFAHQAPGEAALVIKAKPGAQTGPSARPRPLTSAHSWEPPPAQGPTERARLSERAHQDRDIVYFLQQPETNSFSLYHDYTESREGIDKYLNVVRSGSRVSNPSARILDTGEALKTEVMTGAELKKAGIDTAGEQVAADSQVVVVRFPPVKKGQSVRLRISETYAAPQSYRLDGDELAFDRSFGRPRNSVVLPRGWYLTALSIPGIVRQTPDGLTRIDFVNGRPDSIDVLMKAKKTAGASA